MRGQGLQRLTRREQFERVLSSGRRLTGSSFAVLVHAGSGADTARLGIIAGRKAIRRAVDRNRAKRLVREVFRDTLAAFGAIDVVVLCRRPVPRRGNSLARQELATLFARARSWGNERCL